MKTNLINNYVAFGYTWSSDAVLGVKPRIIITKDIADIALDNYFLKEILYGFLCRNTPENNELISDNNFNCLYCRNHDMLMVTSKTFEELLKIAEILKEK